MTDRPMGNCPFCTQDIPEDLLLYGGACPKCFGKIPGEEMATHPGFEVIAEQAASDQRRSRRKLLAPLFLAVPMLGGLVAVAVGFVFWNRDPVIEPLDFDELDELAYEIVVAPPEVEEKVQPKSQGKGKPKSRPIQSGTEATPEPSVPQPAPQPPRGLNFNDDFANVRRQGVAIEDPDKIISMVRQVMKKQSATLSPCYQEALARNPKLQGRWQATFTVSKKGKAQNIQFVGRTMGDAPMEKCLASTVAKWPFSQVKHPQPVRKSWKFNH